MTTSEVLNFTDIPDVDEGIERFDFHEYEPVARTNLNSSGEIRINVEQQNLFTLPSEAFLLFEGRLLKADGTAYANADALSLANNGIMHLFSHISYRLLNQQVEDVYHPGQATIMLGLLKYPNNFQLAQGLNQLWYKDSAATAVLADNTGLATAAAGKVNLDKISLLIPHVIPSDVKRINLYKTIEPKVTIPLYFRARHCDTISVPQSTTFSWRLSVKTSPENPRYIIVGFQTNKVGDQKLNSSIFNRDLKNMYIVLNQERYPAVGYNLSFPNQQFSRAFRDAYVFSEKLYGMNDLITQSNIPPYEYKDLYPLMVFDVSKQSERLKSSVRDVQIKATFNAAVSANTEAFAVVISNKLLRFQSDGNKMNIKITLQKLLTILLMIAMDNGLLNKESIMTEVKEVNEKRSETGEITIYLSLYSAMRGTKHGWRYFELRD
ncbi:uncharacterized protein LOC136086405 [Hydra vulgaris]|uniref:Uncharacterized protein LOC136086405 n=1 Tax=Hydra vulgaris TaxID=6087 RepID=A0ABM4CS97_HYDVU